ncbi:uncharacterized protein LOC144380324 isoform X2 [Halichoerus grypus]
MICTNQRQPGAGQCPGAVPAGSPDSSSSLLSSSCCSHPCMEGSIPPERCCQTWDKFIVIPMDPQKSEAEDCRTYTQETLGPRFPCV